MSQKYVIVHFVKLSEVPKEFPYTEWPLHITLLANFTIAKPLEILVDRLSQYSGRTKSFEIMSDGEAMFGLHQNIAVSLIQPSENIKKMHKELTDITSAMEAEYDDPRFMGEGYRPHATIQVNSRLSDRQALLLDSFTLVDMFPDGDTRRRRIIQTFELADK